MEHLERSCFIYLIRFCAIRSISTKRLPIKPPISKMPRNDGVTVFTGRNEVVAKVMFLQVCVCPQGGGCLPQCMLGCHNPPRWRTPPGWRAPLDGEPPRMENLPPRWRTPPDGEPPRMENTPRMENPPDGEPPPWMENPPTPPEWRTPPDGEPPQLENPPGMENPPGWRTPPEADSSIRTTSSRYASYWNAFLLTIF